MVFFSFFQRLFRPNVPPRRADVLFFGLGNIGRQYAQSRHNIGFRVADMVSQRLGGAHNGRFAEADYSFGRLFDTKTAVTVKPRTLMNRSGDAVAAMLKQCGCPVSGILVIVDDYQLPLGKLRARRGGSDGGHNGLKSIIAAVGENFPRLRVGIGPVLEKMSSIDFVLSDFTGAEEDTLRTVIPKAADACLLFAQSGIDAVMNTYNNQQDLSIL